METMTDGFTDEELWLLTASKEETDAYLDGALIGPRAKPKGPSPVGRPVGPGYMQDWLMMVRQALRAGPSRSSPNGATVDHVALEIANRRGGADWSSGRGFRVSYTTLADDLFMNRETIGKAFMWLEANGFLERDGGRMVNGGEVKRWNAKFPDLNASHP